MSFRKAEAVPRDPVEEQTLSRWTVLFMAVCVGLIVANIYYVQPLLPLLAHEFRISVAQAGLIAMASQLGSASGMFCLVPLGDVVERRALICRLIALEAVFLLLATVSPGMIAFSLAAVGFGFAASCVHVFLPLAAHLANPKERGQVVGTVLSGLLLGILLARTVSGALAAAVGWRPVYALAAILMAILVAFVRIMLPVVQPTVRMRYGELLVSVGRLARKHQQLREAAVIGACLFAAFSAFWTTLGFLLATPPYHYGSQVAGGFGLVGAAGALGSLYVGRLADRYPPRDLVALALVVVLASFILLMVAGETIVGLIVGVVILDFGVQAGHVANQSRIYALDPAARSRLNTFYMCTYFLGGSIGSLAGGYFWQLAGWPGVCGFAITILTLALGYLVRILLTTVRANPASPG